MVKFVISSVLAAAVIAGALTLLTGASDPLDASPLAQPAQATLQNCTQQPWPYLHCVGTPLGNPNVRLITTERLGA